MRMRVSRRARRATLVAVGLLGALSIVGAPPALADQTIDVSTAPNPTTDGVPTTLTVTGSTDTGGSVYATLDDGGTACGANPSSDGHTAVLSGDHVASGAYSDTGTITPAHGDYVVCVWLMPDGDDGSGTPLAGPTATPLQVMPLTATLSITAPVRVAYQQSIPVTVRWTAATPGSLFVNILPASYGPCAAQPGDAPQYLGWLSGEDGYTNNDPIGVHAGGGTIHYAAGEFAAGLYELCAWIEQPSGTVVAGPAALPVRMLAVPSPETYSGRTAQQLPITVSLAGDTVRDIVYSVRFRCGGPAFFASGLRWNGVWNGNVLTAANFGTLSIRNGHFAADLDANRSNVVHIRGAISGRKLTGTLDATMRIGPPQFRRPATCRSGRVRFTVTQQARKRPGGRR